ncbi:uncharacterized protein [Palaemon carinicauda]|uniref:uncharacterized protein n=1 Tax=Palaemon carinicauda TaxID=392227 RepID=UPI0035B65F8A
MVDYLNSCPHHLSRDTLIISEFFITPSILLISSFSNLSNSDIPIINFSLLISDLSSFASSFHHKAQVASADGRRVVILGIQAAASDTYRCEMVAEGPPFHTTQRSGNMTVAVVPNERPLLTGSREYYHLNDLIKLNCTAPFAKPPISLTWYINDHEAELNNVNEIERIINPAELESVSSQLTLSVKRHHFKGSTMSIKCVGRLADLYQRSSQVIIREPSSQWFISSDLYHTSGCTGGQSYRLLQLLLLLQFLLYSRIK